MPPQIPLRIKIDELTEETLREFGRIEGDSPQDFEKITYLNFHQNNIHEICHVQKLENL